MHEQIREAMKKRWDLTDEQLDKALEDGTIYASAMHVEYAGDAGDVEVETVSISVSDFPGGLR